MYLVKSSKFTVITLLLLLVASVGSYFFFQTYRPKVIRQVEDVKGLQTISDSGISFPEGAEKVSTSTTSGTKQSTFYSQKSKEEIQAYYKNIFLSNKWAVESQGTYSDYMITRYQKEDKQTSVLTFDVSDGYKSFVSIETSKF
jgi:hypothetical protein